MPEVPAGAGEEGAGILTNQEKKAKLNQYREAEAEASRLEQEITKWYSKAEKMTTAVRLVPSGGAAGRSLENSIEAIDALAGRLGDKRRETVRLRREIEDVIAAVPDGRLRMLLRYRYIDGMTWTHIERQMGYERTQIWRLHGRALESINME